MSGAPSEKKPAELSSEAQSLLADLVGDDSTRGFVLLPGLPPGFEKNKIQDEIKEDEFAPDFADEKEPEPQMDTAPDTGDDPRPQPGDALLQMMADIEADQAETSASFDASVGASVDASVDAAAGIGMADFTATFSGKDLPVLSADNPVPLDAGEVNGANQAAVKDYEENSEENNKTASPPAALDRVRGIFRQFIGRGNADDEGVLVGSRDVKKTFHLETTTSPLPKTLVLSFILLLTAAVPPVMNFGYIQPTISDYNTKIDKIGFYEAQIKNNSEMSDNLSAQIKNLQRRSEALAATLISQQRYDFILQKFIAAFEQYGGEIISVTNQIDPESSLQLGKAVNVSVNIVTLEIESRFEIYRSIREIFMKEIKSVYVIEEVLTAKPNSNVLKIKLKMAVAYGGEM